MTTKLSKRVLAGVVVLMLAGRIFAQKIEWAGEVEMWPSADEGVRTLVKQLGSADFADREKAAAALRGMGAAAVAGLREGNLSDDAEVRAQCTKLMAELMKGPGGLALVVPPARLPRVPAEAFAKHFADEVSPPPAGRARSGAGAGRLGGAPGGGFGGSQGYGGERGILLGRAIEAYDGDTGRAAIEADFKKQIWIQARLAIVAGDMDGAEKVLVQALGDSTGSRTDRLNGISATYAAFVAMRRGAGFDAGKELERLKRVGLDEKVYNETGLYLYRAAGDWANVVKYARIALPEGGFWQLALVEARDYPACVEWYAANKHWDLGDAIALRAMGKVEEARKVEDENSAGMFRPLIKCDRLEDSLAMLAKQANENEALEWRLMLLAAGRYKEAIGVAGVQSRGILGYAGALEEAGLTEEAVKVLRTASQATTFSQGMEEGDYFLGIAALYKRMGMAKEAQEAEWRGLDATGDRPYLNAMWTLDRYGAVNSKELDFWFNRSFASPGKLTTRYPAVTRVARLDKIFLGKLTHDEAAAFAEEVGRALNAGATRGAAAGQADMVDRAARSFYRLGFEDLAAKLVKDWTAKENDTAELELLGDFAMVKGNAAEALGWYEQAETFQRTDAALMFKVGEAMLQIKGKEEMGKTLMERGTQMALGGGAFVNQPITVAPPTARRGETTGDLASWARADEIARRVGSVDEFTYYDRWKREVERAEARKDWDEAVALQTQILFCNTEAGDKVMHSMASLWRLRALAALQKKDFAGGKAALLRGMDYGLPNVELLKEAVPLLKGVDAAGAAEVMKKAKEKVAGILRDFPETAPVKELGKQLEGVGG